MDALEITELLQIADRDSVTPPATFTVWLHNGALARLPDAASLPDGVIAGRYNDVSQQCGHSYSRFFGRFPEDCHAATRADGIFLLISQFARVQTPIHIINTVDCNAAATPPTRHTIVLQAGSRAQLLIVTCSLSGETTATNCGVDIALCESAKLEMVRIRTINATTQLNEDAAVQQSTSSSMTVCDITIGEGVSSNTTTVRLAGPEAEHTTAGLALTQRAGRAIARTVTIHSAPRCHSSQQYRSILTGASARGEFTGRVIVEQGAQKTEASQRCKSVIMNPKAKMQIQPQLEIQADDVKCSHGAAIGQLDSEALFYLRARGLDETGARNLLLRAFATDALSSITQPQLKENILQLIDRALCN